jgi:hypothetical protein
MQQVKAAIGENHTPAVAFIAAKPHNRFLQCKDGRTQRDSLRGTTTVMMTFSLVVYHAREERRLARDHGR